MNESSASLDKAKQLDANDPLASFRDQFFIPHENGNPDVYFVGNSLGLLPRSTESHIKLELDRWSSLGVRGHFTDNTNWMGYHELLTETMADLVGANPVEVVTMNTLTVNSVSYTHLTLPTICSV